MPYSEYQQYKSGKPAVAAITPDGLTPTTPDIEGPFYLAGAPFRDALVSDATLHLFGMVTDTVGHALVGATLDFWQADPNGEYDVVGFNFRGKVKTDANGRYALHTVRPGDYKISDTEFRCSHIHVKLSVDDFKPLTTQLYFSEDAYNATDHWFSKDRVIGVDGSFDFVLAPEKGP